MNSIISFLVTYNQFLLAQIQKLLVFIAKHIPLKLDKEPQSPAYQKFTVDRLPIIKKPETLNFIILLDDYRAKHGKDLKPVKPRDGHCVPPDTVCHRCGAPHITNETTDAASFMQICGLRFNKIKQILKSVLWYALLRKYPYEKKDRKHFNIHKCVNKKCSLPNSLNKLSPEQKVEYEGKTQIQATSTVNSPPISLKWIYQQCQRCC